MNKKQVVKYPEHEKLQKISDHSQLIGEFLEWLLLERGLVICQGYDGPNEWPDRPYVPFDQPFDVLLAEYFSINQEVVSREKEEMLAQLCNED